jgi:hypothetical protein
MTTPDADAVIQQLYERENLTDSLTDDDARMLLQWAASQITSLAERDASSDQLESYARQLQRVVRSCNRLVGRKAELSDTKMLQQLLGLVENSAQLAQQEAISLATSQADDG